MVRSLCGEGCSSRPEGGEGARHKRNIQSKIDYKDQKEQAHGRSMDVPVRKGVGGE